MKKLLPLLLVLIPFAAKSQTTLTTYYIIPPVNGCDGVWAVDAPGIGCGSGITYMFVPNIPTPCASFGPIVGDTMFLQLCSIPCNLYVNDINGPCQICGTGTTTSIDAVPKNPIITTYPNPATTEGNWNFMLNASGYDLDVKIYNTCGQMVLEQKQENAPAIFSIAMSPLTAGNYFVEVCVNGNMTYHEKLVITR